MKTFLISATLGLFSILSTQAQELYKSSSSHISFFSKAPLENIEAHNKQGASIYSSVKNEIVFFVPVKGFKFDKDLMQTHFNENYLESDKYPDATYKGKVEGNVDFTKDGTYEVTTTGKLKIHGVEKQVSEKGSVVIKGGLPTVKCIFKVRLQDYNIKIPKLVLENIAETVDVTLEANYSIYKK